jgi:prepilin signal peptidase PulO-like enzyme (type II secretory pathway)
MVGAVQGVRVRGVAEGGEILVPLFSLFGFRSLDDFCGPIVVLIYMVVIILNRLQLPFYFYLANFAWDAAADE